MKDQRDMPLVVGQLVAFNLSGTVAMGEITGIREPVEISGRRTTKAKIKIRILHPAQGKAPGDISTVKHEHNLLVI